MVNPANAPPEVALLPKGIAVNFTYQDMPITWQWALAPRPIPRNNSQNIANKNSNGDSADGSNDNANGSNDTANDGSENGN